MIKKILQHSWCQGEPSNGFDPTGVVLYEDCLEISVIGLNDLPCFIKRDSYVCELSL